MLIGFIILISILLFFRLSYIHFKPQLDFLTTGVDNGFSFSEIHLLWKLGREADIENPHSLYVSLSALNQAIAIISLRARNDGTEYDNKMQVFLSKLYKFRTKLDLEHANKKGLESTKYLDKNQRLRIILKGQGVFSSVILNNGYEMTIKVPVQDGIAKVPAENWVDRTVSVYLWRKKDAHYVFDTRVTNSGIFLGQPVIFLAQTNQLLRTQKRKSVRTSCELDAQLYFLPAEKVDYNAIEQEQGYRCIIEDVSEDGAMIRVGGQGQPNARIKLQFYLNNDLIVMFGIIRAVEYNSKINQSRLHFECLHVSAEMKNAILSFVYNVLPESEREVFDALTGTEEDKQLEESAETVEETIDDVVQETEDAAESTPSVSQSASANPSGLIMPAASPSSSVTNPLKPILKKKEEASRPPRPEEEVPDYTVLLSPTTGNATTVTLGSTNGDGSLTFPI